MLAGILQAATYACSTGNTQPWEFVVVTDRDTKRRLQRDPRRGVRRASTPSAASAPTSSIDDTGRPVTGHAAIEHVDVVGAIVFVFWNPDRGVRLQGEYAENPDGTLRPTRHIPGGRGSSLYPACQNMMLAAQALGVSSLFTTFFGLAEPEVRALLHVPPRMFLEAAVFLGYAGEQLGPPRRKPLGDVVHLEDWDGRYEPPADVAVPMTRSPRIVSADDHVVEPPTVWVDRLSARRPRRRPTGRPRARGRDDVPGRPLRLPDGRRRAARRLVALRGPAVPHTRLSACAGFAPEDVQVVPMTYDEMRPGCCAGRARLDDMDRNWVEASLCFPTFPRFCGQTFLEATRQGPRAAAACRPTTTGWSTSGAAEPAGRLFPLCLIPLWDAELAAAEVRRNAARGVRAVCFSELPSNLGLPSVHDPDRFWDPFVRGLRRDRHGDLHAQRLGLVDALHVARRTTGRVVDAHPRAGRGLARRLALLRACSPATRTSPSPTPRARSAGSPTSSPGPTGSGSTTAAGPTSRGLVPEPPSTYYWGRVYGCFFDDAAGLAALDAIGPDQVTFETDYPHADGTWPHSREVAERLLAGLASEVVDKIVRTNALRMLGRT